MRKPPNPVPALRRHNVERWLAALPSDTTFAAGSSSTCPLAAYVIHSLSSRTPGCEPEHLRVSIGYRNFSVQRGHGPSYRKPLPQWAGRFVRAVDAVAAGRPLNNIPASVCRNILRDLP